jgi:hypothetical protein
VIGEVTYIMDNTSENVRCYASFSISGLELDPDEVSELLGISPDRSHRKGEVKILRSGNTIIHKNGHWALRSKLSDYEPFERHLDALLDRLKGKEAALKSLAEENKIQFGCDLWETIGVELPTHILRRIADFNASLGITIYG